MKGEKLKDISYKNFIAVVVYLLIFNFTVFFASSANKINQQILKQLMNN